MSSDTAKPAQIKGWHVLAGVAGFFAVVIAVDATFTVLALRTFPGQVSVTPYEDGLFYNRHLAQQAAQAELGWRATVAQHADGVTLSLRDAADRPVEGLQISGRLERPATEAGRIALAFRETEPGAYRAEAGALSGAWDLTFAAVGAGDRRFEGERRLSWR